MALAVVAAGVVSFVLVGRTDQGTTTPAAAAPPPATAATEPAASATTSTADAPSANLEPPRVALADWSANPAESTAAIRAHVAGALPAFEECYVRRLVLEPSLATRAELAFQIDRRGRPQSVSVSSSDAELAACVSASVSKLRFPKPAGKGSADVRGAVRFYRSADAPPPEESSLAAGDAPSPQRSGGEPVARREGASSTAAPAPATPREPTPAPAEECDANSCLLDPNRPCCARLDTRREQPDREGGDTEPTGDDGAGGAGFRPRRELPSKPSRIEINDAISSARGDLAACSDETGFHGRLVVEIHIAPSGEVREASASGGTPDVHACVTRIVERVRFAESRRGVVIRYPLWLR